jgi:hypothetical protein
MRVLRHQSFLRTRPSRRQVLRMLGVGAGLAPLLPALDGWAAGREPPRRLLLLFTPDGIIADKWWPTGTELDWRLPEDATLAPLMRHRADITVLKGLSRRTSGVGAHQQAMGGLWTGNSLSGGTAAGAASIDQIVARSLAPETDFPSLQLGVQSFYGGEGDLVSKRANLSSYMTFAGPGAPMPAESDPYVLFDRVFAGVGRQGVGDAIPPERLRAEGMSVLDFVRADLAEVRAKVGEQDRRKLDAHLTATREIERRLDRAGTNTVPAPEAGIDLARNANFPALIEVMNRLLVQSLAADHTRVASLQYSRGFSFTKHQWLGHTEIHHSLSHKPTEAPALAAIQKWYMERLATLLDLLKAVREGEGTLLDNMLVVYANELNTGWDHGPGPSPTWWAGRLGGTVRPGGRLLDFTGTHDHNQMLCTIGRAMGLATLEQVGDMGGSGILPGLLA